MRENIDRKITLFLKVIIQKLMVYLRKKNIFWPKLPIKIATKKGILLINISSLEKK